MRTVNRENYYHLFKIWTQVKGVRRNLLVTGNTFFSVWIHLWWETSKKVHCLWGAIVSLLQLCYCRLMLSLKSIIPVYKKSQSGMGFLSFVNFKLHHHWVNVDWMYWKYPERKGNLLAVNFDSIPSRKSAIQHWSRELASEINLLLKWDLF